MIDLNEKLIPLQEVPNHFPAPVSMPTVYRWVARGLEVLRYGRKTFTSAEALARFGQVEREKTEAELEAEEDRQQDEIERKLEKLGA
ncbi:MAG: hypothetical protein PVG39_30410 [Desulfobacteraceae bacterium]|jgi:hypothetical protein